MAMVFVLRELDFQMVFRTAIVVLIFPALHYKYLYLPDLA
jgi:hypothetical protein